MTSLPARYALVALLVLVAVGVELLARQATPGGRLALDLAAVLLALLGLALTWRARAARRAGDRFHTEPRREA